MTAIVAYRRTEASIRSIARARAAAISSDRGCLPIERRPSNSAVIAYANARLRALRKPKKGMDLVCQRICAGLGVTMAEVRSACKKNPDVVLARHAIAYWGRRRLGLSLLQIGLFLGRDHTTVLYGSEVYPKKRAAMGRTLRTVR